MGLLDYIRNLGKRSIPDADRESAPGGKTYRLTSTTGESFELELPKPADHPSFFAFALHKSGSTLMCKMIREALAKTDLPVVNVCGMAFAKGIRAGALDASMGAILHPDGYGYISFRQFLPDGTGFDLTPVKKILLVRDPRDMVVSMYFSQKESHKIPQGEGTASKGLVEKREKVQAQTLEEYIHSGQTVGQYVDRFQKYFDCLPGENLRIYRYEDVIFRKYEWLKDMLQFLDIKVPDRRIRKVAEENDIRPTEERTDQHIRQVTPGNYQKHLSEKTIEYLNELFRPILRRFGYLSSEPNARLYWMPRLSPFPKMILNATYPRSGNTLLLRMLRDYFGPGELQGLLFHGFRRISSSSGDATGADLDRSRTQDWAVLEDEGFNWVKHHDFGLIGPDAIALARPNKSNTLATDPERRYVVQYRHPLGSSVSFFERQLRLRPEEMSDTRDDWERFCQGAVSYWERFVEKWPLNDEVTDKLIVSYESLTDDLFGMTRRVIEFATGDSQVDEEKLRAITDAEQRESTRDIRDFRFFDEAFFKAQEARVMHLFDALNITPMFN